MSKFADVVIDESELENGFSAHEVFSNSECLGITFDDLITLPGEIDFSVEEVDLQSKLTRNIKLNYPLCSSPMDTVTETAMAIGMALNGGIGIIHANCDVETQVAMVEKVKMYENGFILSPAVLSPQDVISDLDSLRKERKISGVPVTVDGRVGSRLVGLVSNRDTDFLSDRTKTIAELMTPIEQLVTGKYPITIEEANEILKVSKKGYLPLIDENGNLKALTTRSDLKKNKAHPMASKDVNGKLLVGAAIRAGVRDEIDMYRVESLYEAGVDVIVLDAQNGDCDVQVTFIKEIKSRFPKLDVIAGNVVRSAQAKLLLEAGADGIRVGMGVGSVATTQLVKAVGRAQLSCIYAVSRIAKSYGVPVIADGGIKNTGCLIKALSIGASVVMMGHMLAGVDESPGDYFFQNGVRLKNYRANFIGGSFNGPAPSSIGSPTRSNRKNMTPGRSEGESAAAMAMAAAAIQARMANGVSGTVIDKGPLNRYVPYLLQSIRHGLQDMGTHSVTNLHEQMYTGKLRFELRSTSAQKEGGVHDLHSFSQRLYA
jgi:IMP dehydrogenase